MNIIEAVYGHMLQNGEAGPGPVVTIDINVPDAYLILTNDKTYTLPAGTCTHVYGSSGVNTIIMEVNVRFRDTTLLTADFARQPVLR